LSKQESKEILTVKKLTKTFGGLVAVDSVDLSINEASITGLIGPNGSGKSTLFNLISGVTTPDAGNIRFENEEIDSLPSDMRFKKGLARGFQDPRLFFGMNVFENMLVPPINQKGENPLFAIMKNLWRQQEIDLGGKAKSVMEELRMISVALNSAEEISAGQMKLLQLGQLLMNSPKLVLLDEPTAGVAPSLTEEIFEIIKQMRDQRQITFFIIEHKLQVLFKYVDFVYVMHRGRIFAGGTPEEVVANPELREIYL